MQEELVLLIYQLLQSPTTYTNSFLTASSTSAALVGSLEIHFTNSVLFTFGYILNLF
ncbi:hypothetical protein CLV24_13912 [Pontibacter ummariensis]|uniref:Uncharacterized protein n=1 Tax=Pontibacter ummariensis TaxID=1610492 RepID=A0A239LEF2_9BACT|nr:hypothetical protein CLV24_13912 [Pontibacter ummariensis]SNT28223.1 hypothetical protein SAMN06296052_13920 [Pontibacter ummariensis]